MSILINNHTFMSDAILIITLLLGILSLSHLKPLVPTNTRHDAVLTSYQLDQLSETRRFCHYPIWSMLTGWFSVACKFYTVKKLHDNYETCPTFLPWPQRLIKFHKTACSNRLVSKICVFYYLDTQQ
jgi:hypothetical protein